MGGCCAPGTLGARSAAMVDGISSSNSQATKGGGGGGSSCGDVAELRGGEDEQLGVSQVSSSTVEKREATALDVEKLLRVLEMAVEREYVDGLRDHPNANHGQHQENIAYLRLSLAESSTSLYSIARSMLSENGSNKNHVSSPKDGESCSLEKEKLGPVKNQRLYEDKERTSFNWGKRLETALESMHHVEKGDFSLELKPSTTSPEIKDNTRGNFEKILQQILAFDSQGRSTPILTQCLPEILTDFDDYPRGSSDTNSEDAERDKKTVCNTPLIDPICPNHQDKAVATTTSFISLGLVQCQLREKLAIPTSYSSEGSMRVDKSGSPCDRTKEILDRAIEPISNTLQIDQGKIQVDDSYASWLDRHSEELGWKKNSKYKRKGDLNEEVTCTQDDWSLPNGESRMGSCGLNPLQKPDSGFQPDCSRSWTSQCGLPEVELHTQDSERSNVAHVEWGQSYNNKHREIVDDFETPSSTSLRIQGTHEQTSQVCSFQLGAHVNGSFKFSPRFQLDDVSHAPLKSYQIPNPSYFDPRRNLEDQKDWVRSGLGKFPKPTIKSIASLQMTSPRHVSQCGGAKIRQNPYLRLGNPSNALHRGLSCSKLNSRAETPLSILSEGRSYATNVVCKVKVCVRMRPFHDHEKVCPLRQLLCVMGKKIVVKEYGGPALRRSLESSDIDLLEFRVDDVLDDSHLQAFQVEQKEDSQRRMYESIGLPCLEYALDGYNTTVLACGQVGTGKTYTMIGDGTEEGKGLMPRLAKDLMNHLNTDFKGEFEVQVSYLEIYQEKIRDLLAAQKLELQDSRGGSMRSCAASFFDCSDESTYEHSVDYDTASNATFFEGTPRSWRTERMPSVYFDPVQKKEFLRVREHPVTGPYVEGLLWKTVTTWQDLETVMLQGAANRTLAATPLNKLSSRGHTLFTIKLIRGGRRFVHGYPSPSFSLINLVDLAGTEKPQSAKKTSLERLEESRYINRSLAQLNDVILNLSRNKKFISYRSSALTWLLRDSLGGNSKLFLIANISPAEQDFQESVNTLRYASRANRIHGIISSDPDSKKQVIVRMKKEIQVLHNLVHDLTKNKIAECVSEELRRAQQHLPSQCQGPVYERTGVHNRTKNKIAERVSEELRRAQCLPSGQSSKYDQCLTKKTIAECVTEELRRAQQQLPLQCQASEYEPMGMYMDTTNLPELFI